MHVANIALAVNDRVHRHASKFKEVDFLFVKFRNRFFDIRQSDEGDVILAPVIEKSGRFVRSHGQDFGPPRGELCVTIPQARQLRATVRSHEAAQESQHDHFFSTIG